MRRQRGLPKAYILVSIITRDKHTKRTTLQDRTAFVTKEGAWRYVNKAEGQEPPIFVEDPDTTVVTWQPKILRIGKNQHGN